MGRLVAPAVQCLDTKDNALPVTCPRQRLFTNNRLFVNKTKCNFRRIVAQFSVAGNR